MTTLHEEPLNQRALLEENEDSYSDPECNDYDVYEVSCNIDFDSKDRSLTLISFKGESDPEVHSQGTDIGVQDHGLFGRLLECWAHVLG